VGGTHTTTSTSVPAGANTWSSSINSSTTSFTYTVTIAGTYNYQCNFHFSMGMVGVLNVTAATSTPSVNEPAVSKYYPNPVHGVLNLEFNSNLYSGIIDISVSDMLGREVNKQQITVMPKQEANYPVDFSSLAPGNYIVKLRQADNEIGAVKIAKE
jgi:Secretion system C-terminal sorting domain/Copper binding proteins, plastocyanin/azurin family